jgi:hypothetical protein
MELAIINGTYRDSQSKNSSRKSLIPEAWGQCCDYTNIFAPKKCRILHKIMLEFIMTLVFKKNANFCRKLAKIVITTLSPVFSTWLFPRIELWLPKAVFKKEARQKLSAYAASARHLFSPWAPKPFYWHLGPTRVECSLLCSPLGVNKLNSLEEGANRGFSPIGDRSIIHYRKLYIIRYI